MTHLRRATLGSLASAVLTITAAFPAIAQEEPQQTREGAFQFLDQLARKGSVQLLARGGYSVIYNSGKEDDYRIFAYLLDVKALGRQDECTTSIKTNLDPKQPEREPASGAAQLNHWVKPVRALEARGIDWRKVSSVVVGQGYIPTMNDPSRTYSYVLVLGQGSNSAQFTFAGVGITERAAHAMEFLRLSCDEAATTGF